MLFAILVLAAGALAPSSPGEVGRPLDASLLEGRVTRFKVELAGAKDTVQLGRLKGGEEVFIVRRLGASNDVMLSPAEFARMLYAQRTTGGWFNTVLNITSPAGAAWVAVGLGGQLLFTGRMLVQWIASEKNRRSVVPVAFWWMSLVGASMLLVYFIWRRDIVGILGQATGWAIYVRNLILIRRSRTGP